MWKCACLSLLLLFASQGVALATPQDGTVLSHQKISRTMGGGAFSFDKDDQFGRAVVSLGDLDGDGVQDIVVGAHGDDDGGTSGNSSNTGAVYVVMLNPDGTVRDRQKISKLRGNFTGDLDDQDQFGRAIGNIGDFDGDGVTDIAVGTAFDDDGGVRRGAIWLLYLNSDGTVKEHRKISSTSGGFAGPLDDDDQFGRAVVSPGDLDGNGVPDLAVGAAFDDDGGTAGPNSNVGAVWILFMNADGTVASHQKISATAGGFTGLLENFDNFGLSLASIGDLDSDGVPDLAVGEPKDADGGHRRGAVWILFLNSDGTVKAQQKISDLAGGFDGIFTGSDEFGTGITTIGDPNDDGVVDLAVGAVLDDEIGDDRGACWILFMNTDGTVKGHEKINSLHGNFTGVLNDFDWFGSSVGGLHDLDGDGKQDLAVGARFDDDGGANRGAVWILFLEGQTSAAPVPGFDASPTVGPTPLSVDFTDRSTAGATTWSWDFGDGGSSTEENPTHVYSTHGTYDVALTVSGPGGADTLTRNGLVEALPDRPTAAFDATPTSGSAPLSVQFTDLSTGVVDSWLWEFGDGAVSTEASPSHVYSQGTYDVRLTVTNAGGMDSLLEVALLGVAPPPPRVDFCGRPVVGPASLEVDFFDLSTGDVTGWDWDFGDGGGSTLEDPTYVYTTPGTYTVSLTATGPGGATNETKVDYVRVFQPPTAAFSGTPTQGVAPLGVTFTDRSSGMVTTWDWDFGDGGSSTEQDPVHVYAVPGTYTVALTVTGPTGADDETEVDYILVTATSTMAEFDGVPTSGPAPHLVSFADQSSGMVDSWSWDFGDGATSTERHPVHTYAEPGTYTVSLVASGPGGSDSRTRTGLVTVSEPPPVADFQASVTEGLPVLTVAFSDLSTGDVGSWAWGFGDGGTSTEASPSHDYDTPGSYTVSLSVTGPHGSDVETRVGHVTVHDPVPGADFGAASTDAFPGDAIDFLDLSTGDITSWDWDFGDGAGSLVRHPTHAYVAPGDYTVSLTVAGPSGADTRIRSAFVRVADPVPSASFAGSPTSGPAPLAVGFQDLSAGRIDTWLWDFGDGTTSAAQDPLHVYADAGTYAVSLTVTGADGSDQVVQPGLVAVAEPAPVAAFSVDVTEGWAPLSVAFTDLSSGPADAWSWDFGDGTSSSERHPTHVYTAAGSYGVVLTVSGPGGQDATAPGAVLANPPPPVGIRDPSFEEQTSGAEPAGAWEVFGGTDHRVAPDAVVADGGMPSHGGQWLELRADGTFDARPPSNPGGLSAAPEGGAGVLQRFRYAPGETLLVFDAAFLRNGAGQTPAFNDWMSVDVDDGKSSWNLYYRDTYSETLLVSAACGFQMTATETETSELRALFPDSDEDTVFTLRIQVGNGGDGEVPSRGYLDDVRLLPVATVRPYGCGVNPEDSLTVLAGEPTLGTTLVLGVDNPPGTQAPGSRAMLALSLAPHANHPCGGIFASLGMDGAGELLLSLAPANRIRPNLVGARWTVPGEPAPIDVAVPDDPALVGLQVFVQGLLFDPTAPQGARIGLAGAFGLVLAP